jgi:hypothetical protein
MEILKIIADIPKNAKAGNELYIGNSYEMTQSSRENITF